jgi:hypothetical protein
MNLASWLILLVLFPLAAGPRLAPDDTRPFFETRVLWAAGDHGIIRHCYPTVAALPDGRLFMVWTAQDTKARIVGSFSHDNGATWSAPEELINTPGFGDYDPSIILSHDEIQVYSTSTRTKGEILFSETWKSSRPFSGERWSNPVRIPQHRRYVVGKIHVGMTLADGTLLMPYSWDIPAEEGRPSGTEGRMELKSGVLRSQDGGKTWVPGADVYTDPPRTSDFSTGGLCEPSMVLLDNGEIYALFRTADEWHYESRSEDGGLSWSPPVKSPLHGHNTPAAMARLAGRPDVLVVWNNSPRNRWPLDVALSTDGCRTFSRPKTLADTPGFQCSYPGAAQAGDGNLVVLWQQERADKKGRDVHIARFNRDWLLSQQE